jgi:hypothetical protein
MNWLTTAQSGKSLSFLLACISWVKARPRRRQWDCQGEAALAPADLGPFLAPAGGADMTSTRLRWTLTWAGAIGLIIATLIAPGLTDARQLSRMALASMTVPTGPSRSFRPSPPRLPANFRGRGRFIVSDLGVNVPFSWEGNRGNSQMDRRRSAVPDLVHQSDLPQHALHSHLQMAEHSAEPAPPL